MSITGPVPLKDVKNRFSEMVDQVEREHDRVIITKHGRPAAVLISMDDLASLEETLDALGSAHVIGQIGDSLAEIEAGQTETLSKDDALRMLGNR
jgi:antitoxin YefM